MFIFRKTRGFLRVVRRHLRLIVAAAFLASPARAGKLDLDLYGVPPPRFSKVQGPQVPKGAPWLPGDLRHARGESFAVQALASGGSAGLGLAGLAQNAGAAGKSREAAAMSAGFGAIALMGLWRTWRLWRDPAADEKPKK
ncbi:MAG: hypothetical protein NDJ72_06710 [Elusimicrobia bacterium]|nr:hypothetical protein [Elusimicrobiota bacterium]